MDEREPTDVDFEVISGPDAPPPPPAHRWSFLDNDLPVIVGILAAGAFLMFSHGWLIPLIHRFTDGWWRFGH